VSPDGRWAYTLYTRAGKEPPFIHALDTRRGTAVCIDLDAFGNGKAWRYSLQPAAGGSELSLVDRGTKLASVDLSTYEVSAPPAAADPSGPADAGGGGPLWLAIGAAGALVLATGALMLRRRRGRAAVGDTELERLVVVDDPEAAEQREGECEPVR
jgi:hypothetical protein